MASPVQFILSFILISCALGIPYSRGYYRVPYATNTKIRVSFDHTNHDPIGRIDMSGRDGTTYRIVSAAAGYIRYIEDSYTGQSTGDDCFNNYLWIEHPNGEWTKYSHLARNSISNKAGLKVGQWVNMGTYLGDEDDVGCADGDHLHFEVGVPRSTNPITTIGGFLNDNSGSKRNRIPRICGILGGKFKSGTEYTASWQPTNYVPGHPEVARHGLPIDKYQCQFDQMMDAGYEISWLDMFDSFGRTYVNVVGHMRTASGSGFHNLNSAQYQNKFTSLKGTGFKPVQVDSYLLNGRVRYAGYFKKIFGPDFAGYHDASAATHQQKFNAWTKIGYFPTSLSVTSVNNERKYTGVYEKKSQGSIIVKSQVTTAQYQKVFDDNIKAGRRPAYLNGYKHAGQAYLVTIFNSVTPTGGKYRHGLTSGGYQNEYDSARAGGQLTRIVTGYEDSGTRYAGGWRK